MAGQEGNSSSAEGDEQYGALKCFLKNGWLGWGGGVVRSGGYRGRNYLP